MKPKFKKRYVLGEGYPRKKGIKPKWINTLTPEKNGTGFLYFDWPEELLWKSKRTNHPKYRVVLEMVE